MSTLPPTTINAQQAWFFILNGALPVLAHSPGYERQLGRRLLLAHRTFSALIIVLVLGIVGLQILDNSLFSLAEVNSSARVFIMLALVVFTLEYGLRYWSATQAHPDLVDSDPEVLEDIASHRYAWEYARSFLGIVDLVSILALVFFFIEPNFVAGFHYLGVLALFKLSRYVPGLELVGTVIRNERQPLTALVIALAILVVVLSTALFLVENAAQPEMFKNVPAAMWWGIVTMTTTGYGDMTPVTWIGRILGAMAMLVGIAMLAMPAGILSNGFAEEMRRREQLRAWQIISNFKLFAGLDSACLADIAGCLKTQVLPARIAIVKKNAVSDAIFFIADGEVEVEVRPKPSHPVRLHTGDVFGEAGLIENKKRNATIRTVRSSRILVLELRDFHRLLEDHPSLRAKIEAINAARQT